MDFPVLCLQAQFELAGLGVFPDIGDGLLGNPEQGEALLLRAIDVLVRQVERDGVTRRPDRRSSRAGLPPGQALEQRRAEVVDDAPLDGDARADGVDEAPKAGLDVGPGLGARLRSSQLASILAAVRRAPSSSWISRASRARSASRASVR
jgi:hypothetical protein